MSSVTSDDDHFNGPKPAFTECEECLKQLDYGLLAWERHVEKTHDLANPLISIPYCSTINVRGEKALFHPVDANEIIWEMKEMLPSHLRYSIILGLKLVMAIEKQNMMKQIGKKEDYKSQQ